MNSVLERVYEIGIIPVIAFNSVDEAIPLRLRLRFRHVNFLSIFIQRINFISKSKLQNCLIKTMQQTERSGLMKIIFIIKNNNTATTISESYHKNYFEIKSQIQDSFTYLGYERFSYIKDLKEMFKWY